MNTFHNPVVWSTQDASKGAARGNTTAAKIMNDDKKVDVDGSMLDWVHRYLGMDTGANAKHRLWLTQGVNLRQEDSS